MSYIIKRSASEEFIVIIVLDKAHLKIKTLKTLKSSMGSLFKPNDKTKM